MNDPDVKKAAGQQPPPLPCQCNRSEVCAPGDEAFCIRNHDVHTGERHDHKYKDIEI